MTNLNPATALTIAGSDNSAGAGIQADLKTFSSLDVYGLTALTCIVAEVPGKVSAIQPVEIALVEEQIRMSLEHFPVGAIKTGMLFSADIALCVTHTLQTHGNGIPLVVDPVMVATSGDLLLREDAMEIYRRQLFPMARVVTPNLDEAQVLVGRKIQNLEEMEIAGLELSAQYCTAFLMKGGHLKGGEAVDLLIENGLTSTFTSPYIVGIGTHGTGCTFSSAIAAWLALGFELGEAVARSKKYITAAIQGSLRWEKRSHLSIMALNHFHNGKN